MARSCNVLSCPECTSQRVWRDGMRRTDHGDVQRWLCRDCGYRFSEFKIKGDVIRQVFENPNSRQQYSDSVILNSDSSSKKISDDLPLRIGKDIASHVKSHASSIEKNLNTFRLYNRDCRVCVSEVGAKNLAEMESVENGLAGATLLNADAKGKIVEFAWWLKNQGKKEPTIKLKTHFLLNLFKHGADLTNPESVKEVVARQETWSDGTKSEALNAYASFAKMANIKIQALPIYKRLEKLPFIPLEKEVNDLIAGCGKKVATFLQLLKETGARAGEAWQLKWIDVDIENNTIRINAPEKNSKPRVLKVSPKLVAMLNSLPKTSEKVWGKTSLATIRTNFIFQRRRLSHKLQNPRLMEIHFHTFRHWKATVEYHKTKDILYVQNLLGHRNIENTLIYTHLINFESDDFHSSTATTVEEAKKLIESGFEYVCTYENTMLFRKRK